MFGREGVGTFFPSYGAKLRKLEHFNSLCRRLSWPPEYGSSFELIKQHLHSRWYTYLSLHSCDSACALFHHFNPLTPGSET